MPEEPPARTGDDDVLAQRLAELTHREVALRRITEVVEKQRTVLEERERALESSTSAAAAAGEKRLAEAILRAERAEERVRELDQRVSELETRPEPEERPVEVAPANPAPVAAAVPGPTARPVDLDGTEVNYTKFNYTELNYTESTYTLQRLERLVQDAQLRDDPQAEEWAYYLPLLREHAEPDGRLPAQFVSLVDSIFAD